MAKTILILGASYAGLSVAHKLLKHTLTTVTGYKVVIVSPNSHHYWNLASVRAIVPGQIPDEKIFQEIAPGFKQYPSTSYEVVQGTATSLDPTGKIVTISTPSGERKQSYDILVLATGSRTIGDVPWKSSLSGYEATKAGLHKVQEQVKAAKSIVVGGAGPTGVETTGELAFEFGKTKNITLVTAGKDLLEGSIPTHIAKGAEAELKRMKVNIVKGTRIDAAKPLESGQTELKLSNGETILTDLYLPTIGIIPNSDYIPKHLLNEKGEVQVDGYLRVKSAEDIWAAGDISDCQPSQFVYCQKQGVALAKNLDLFLKSKQPVAYKSDGDPILAVTLGRSKATGRAGKWKLPSIVVWFVKGRTLGVQNLNGLVTGSDA